MRKRLPSNHDAVGSVSFRSVVFRALRMIVITILFAILSYGILFCIIGYVVEDVPFSSCEGYAWSPDGRKLAYFIQNVYCEGKEGETSPGAGMPAGSVVISLIEATVIFILLLINLLPACSWTFALFSSCFSLLSPGILPLTL